MTGYGKSVCQLKNKQVVIEIKTLNSKNADIFFKIPATFREKEQEMRKYILQTLVRGKIECFIYESFENEANDVVINQKTVDDYLRQLQPILSNHRLKTDTTILRSVLSMPNVYNEKQEVLSETEWNKMVNTLKDAVDKVNAFRQSEGSAMEADILNHNETIKQLLNQISQFEQKRVERLSERWRSTMEQLKIEVDENRFEQELIFFLDKLDISEEKVRLKKHIRFFEETIISKDISKGKKMGFIVQEMNREINTIGSKANDADIQKIVVQMKDELEKIREQINNIL